jgi:glycine/D-amino acid oxidase-like deaminating enzyme
MKIAVIGAGIVGISSANWLQKYGQDVTLFDMNDPGSQASFGMQEPMRGMQIFLLTPHHFFIFFHTFF